MKKLIIFLMVCFLCFMTIGCSSSDESEEKQQEPETSETADDSKDSKQETKMETTIQEQVVYSDHGITITVTGYNCDAVWGDEIKFLIENTTKQDVIISGDVIVDNCQMLDGMYFDVASESKKNETITLSDLEKYTGDTTVEQIELYFYGYDSDTWEDIFKDQYYCIQTSSYNGITNGNLLEGNVVLESNGIKIIQKDFDKNSFWGAQGHFVVVNTTGSDVIVSLDNLKVNGYSLDGSWMYADVKAGKMSYESMTIMSSSLEENDISEIEEIKAKFNIINANTFSTIIGSDYVDISVGE